MSSLSAESEFFGHIVSAHGIQADPQKTERIWNKVLRTCDIVLCQPQHQPFQIIVPFILDTDANDIVLGKSSSSSATVMVQSTSWHALVAPCLVLNIVAVLPEEKSYWQSSHWFSIFNHTYWDGNFCFGLTMGRSHGLPISRNWKLGGQLARWLEFLQEFNFLTVHRPWSQHANADSLSHQPCSQCGSQGTPRGQHPLIMQ